jgi:DNA-binding beta-propeller fold protein YncE
VDPASHRLYVTHATRVVVIDAPSGKVVGEIAGTPGVHGVALAPELARGFTSNGRDSTVTVFDLGTLATIAVLKLDARNPDAITYDPASRRVFAFNGSSANATVIDAKTNAIVGAVALGGRPELAVADGGAENATPPVRRESVPAGRARRGPRNSPGRRPSRVW